MITPSRTRRAQIVLLIAAVIAALVGAAPPASAATPPTSAAAAPAASYNGLSLTPPMGFNDWQHYRCDISEQTIVDAANALAETGLARHGYDYVNVDDCWLVKQRDANGNLEANPATFPHGMAWLAAYVHRLGLKFGIYEDGGYQTCGGYPGMYGHFQQDADTFAAWGVDYLKLDYCNQPTDKYPGLTAAQVAKIVYSGVSKALLNTHRPMVFSESAPAYFCCSGTNFTDIMSWVGQTGNLWRFGDDIQPNWPSVLTNYSEDNTPGLASYAGPGHWNDADMLLAGTTGTTATEQQSQFSLWAEMASPLLLSADLGALPKQTIAMLSDRDVIAVDQDPLGRQGTIVASDPNSDVLAKPLAGGDVSVALFNKSSVARNISTTAAIVGLPSSPGYRLTDLWSHQVTGSGGTISADVQAHGVAMIRVHEPAGAHLAPSVAIAPSTANLTATGQSPVTLTIADHGSSAITDVTTSLVAPSGWKVTPSRQRIGLIPAGGTASARFEVTPSAQPPGTTSTTLTVRTGYRVDGRPLSLSGDQTATIATPYPSFTSALDNIGITDDSDTNPPGLGTGIDNYQGTFSAEALAANGFAAGKPFTTGGITFTPPAAGPGRADNVVATGQVIDTTGSGSTLAFLASAGFGPAGGTGTVTYTDGTTASFTLTAPDWTSIPSGASVAVSTPYHNVPGTGKVSSTSDIYLATVPLDQTRTVAAVTLPVATGHSTLSVLHIFAIAIQ